LERDGQQSRSRLELVTDAMLLRSSEPVARFTFEVRRHLGDPPGGPGGGGDVHDSADGDSENDSAHSWTV
jgi:hypothetical protein